MSNKGFNLLELMVAIFIFVIIVSGMLAIFSQAEISISENLKRNIAYNLAREKLEEDYKWPVLPESRAQVSGFPGFERQVTVNNYYYPQLANVNVTIWWNGGQRNQTFQTLKTDY